MLIDELIPFIDANFRNLADQRHRAMAGLSMGGMQTRQIALANLDKFSHIGIFSGGSVAPSEITEIDSFKKKVKVVFVSDGSRERGVAAKANVEALQQAGVKSVFYESPETAHEWFDLAAQPVSIRAAAVPGLRIDMGNRQRATRPRRVLLYLRNWPNRSRKS